jgi:hypothetical protein
MPDGQRCDPGEPKKDLDPFALSAGGHYPMDLLQQIA